MKLNYLAFFLYQILIVVLCYWYNTKSHSQMDYFETITNIYYILVSVSQFEESLAGPLDLCRCYWGLQHPGVSCSKGPYPAMR